MYASEKERQKRGERKSQTVLVGKVIIILCPYLVEKEGQKEQNDLVEEVDQEGVSQEESEAEREERSVC